MMIILSARQPHLNVTSPPHGITLPHFPLLLVERVRPSLPLRHFLPLDKHDKDFSILAQSLFILLASQTGRTNREEPGFSYQHYYFH